jgi:colanic acid/amylovoran biosynthesis glycosyltransferase
MKVAFFVNDFPSFTQTFVLRQIAGVMERGSHVVIYAKRRTGLQNTHRLLDKHRMIDKTFYLPDVPRSRMDRLAGLLIACVKKGVSNGWPCFIKSVNFFEYGREGLSLKLAHQCLPFLGDGHFDILHSQFGWLGATVCKLRYIGALSGKVVTAFRGYDTEQYLNQNPGAFRHLFKHGDLFLPVCDYFKKWLIKNKCPEEKIEVLPSGIDLREFTFKPRKYEQASPIRLLSVARMKEKKGLRYALDAVGRLINAGRNLHYTILGDGPLRSELERQTAELGISDYVQMPGMKPHGEVLSEIYRSHVLLAPSITAKNGDHEGIPNSLKEAMATGIPVISTWHAGIPELVSDRKSGFLVPEKDVEALEDRLRILIDHPDLWEIMGRSGRVMIEKNFDIHFLNARMFELYRMLCSKFP